MFTGIITAVGRVGAVEPFANGRRFDVAVEPSFLDRASNGESIAVDGACLTVVAFTTAGFTVEAVATTLSRTTLGGFDAGRRVNLERALALGERLGGHLVQGHIDGVGRIEAVQEHGEHVLIDIALPDDVTEVTVLHGSIAVDGVSLTVNALPAPGRAQVAVIPYTWKHTNLSRLRPGSFVNVEGDMLGRFVIDYLKRRAAAG